MNPINFLIEKLNQNDLWMDEIHLERNEYLKVKGSIDTNIYLVITGSLRIFVIDEDEEHTIRFGYKNNLITALDSFLTEKPSDFYIQALKSTSLKVIDSKTFKSFISSSEKLQTSHKTIRKASKITFYDLFPRRKLRKNVLGREKSDLLSPA